MRPKINPQDEFEFQPSNLKLTNDYYAKYQAISAILGENQKIIDTIHRDLTSVLEKNVARDKRGAKYKFTSDTILRIVLCQIIEGCSLREIIIRMDDSNFLRRFVRIFIEEVVA